MVYSRFNRPASVPETFGSGLEPVFEERIVDGIKKLIKVNDNPINEYVQKSLPDTLIYNIIAKYEKGNLDVLDRAHGAFIDVTGMPTNLAEAQNLLIKANKFFDSLPVDVKASFSNSSTKFADVFLSGKLKDYLPEKYFNDKSEVKAGVPIE